MKRLLIAVMFTLLLGSCSKTFAKSFVDALVWWHMDEYDSGVVYTEEDLRDYNGDNTTFTSVPNAEGPIWTTAPEMGPGGGSNFLYGGSTGGAVEFRENRGTRGDEIRFAGDDLKINGDITLWFRLKFDMTESSFLALPTTSKTIAQNLDWNGGQVRGWMFRLTNNYDESTNPALKVPQLNWLWGQNEPDFWNEVWTGDKMSVPLGQWIDISACIDTVNGQTRLTCYSTGNEFKSAVYNFNDTNYFDGAVTVKGLVNYINGSDQFNFGGLSYDGGGDIDMTVESAAVWNFALSLNDVEALSSYEFGTACGEEGWLDADINKDCKVNFTDFAIMADNWLN
jgi:hypothetical protein